jgi:hypothetical protein
MTSKKELVKHRFAQELIRCCGSHFKTIPSNEQFARDFLLSSKYKLKVSREAVRKWFKGETFPDLDYFLHLIEWLKLDISKIFPNEIVIDLEKIPVHLQYLNIEGANQITPEQIDAFVSLLDSIKKSNFLVSSKFESKIQKP